MKKIIFICALSCILLTNAASADITAYGELTDDTGDSLSPTTDLTFASVTITSSGDATFRAIYAPGYDPSTTVTYFFLDVDRNTSTGISLYGLGVDVIAGTTGAGFEGTGFYESSPLNPPFILVPATYFSNGTEATFPSVLGSSDGWMNFAVSAHVELAYDSFTPVQDFAPNNTFFPGTIRPVPVPEPATLVLAGIGLGCVNLLRRRKHCLNVLDKDK